MSNHLSSDSIGTSSSSESSSPDEDAKVTVDFEIEEDVEAELSEFVRLSYNGLFSEAERNFRKCLSSHQNLFPVAAEYGDFLLRQEWFEYLSMFTSSRRLVSRAMFAFLRPSCMSNTSRRSILPHRFKTEPVNTDSHIVNREARALFWA